MLFRSCDIVPQAMKKATECSRSLGAKSTFVVADGSQSPFREATFDAIASSDVLGHVEDPESAVKEWFRILKDEGIVSLHTESVHYRERWCYRNIIKRLGFDPWGKDRGHISLLT